MTKRRLMAVALVLATGTAATAAAQEQPESPAPAPAPDQAAPAEPAAPPATSGAAEPGPAPAEPPAPPEAPVETVTEAAAPAEPTLAAPKISGFVDATYNYNARDPMSGTSAYHSYDAQHGTVLLNAAHLALTGASDVIAYAIEVDIGSDAAVNSGDDDVDLQEAYVAYSSKMGLGVKAGKFVTFSGIEVIESGMNPTISRGFLFGLAECFTHAGVVLTYKLTPELDAAFGVVNGWDVVEDNNDGKTLAGKVGYTTAGWLATLSGYAGPEQPEGGELDSDNVRLSGDLTGMVKLGPVDLWAQVNAGSEEGASTVMAGETARWVGAGLQPVWRVLERLAIGARGEVFSDRQGARTGIPQTLYNLSVAPAFTIVSGFVVRGELRVDRSNKRVFEDDEAVTHRDQVVALTEAIYSF